ncbi:FKBP-type peptidyl-prolyl cis-trans isomerase [Microbacterium sp. TNHR37B]|uniref:FKBP-type peptidyl-prolyl cis-trans isomerase n=1 Tax=Microbacterium sp. TNHR37B TaxID=1775956 RepID=UPI0007B17BB6|nr:FKBP-type peptidyl-prolyl cis-trans isomerase [Microbacterium sp. TNHR37B]KZE90797.1 putative FKBP-type peptidyl-prolyl cis-trans isomerase [Microbacterium sp. TNHR37B]
MLRRISAVVAVIGLSAFALVGCSSSAPNASCERPHAESSALGLIDASGEVGKPTLSVKDPVHVSRTSFVDETVGTGTRVTAETQDVAFSITLANGATGETLVATPTDARPLSGWREHYAGLADMMMCATEGSRIVGAMPVDAVSPEAASSMGLSKGDSIAVVLDLQRVYLAAADGAPQYNDRPGMPSVVLAPSGAPGIIVPDAAPPADLAVEVLKRGDGPTVTDADSIRVQYTGVTWADRKVFDSTWESGASAVVTLDGVVPGFAKALEGATVGSQILMVIPPELGYGEKGSGAIPGGATLVFVVDVLGVDQKPAASQ